ncbi:MAG TPA: hypothetical protein VH879_06380 [Gemmatimonadales bacterium]|jgi:hypothetical protein
MRSEQVSPTEAAAGTSRLIGAVLLGPVRLGEALIAKGTRVDATVAETLGLAARRGALTRPLRLGWAESGDLHEDEAALRLARAVAGPGITIGSPTQSRVNLAASVDGVLRVRIDALAELNRIDPLEVFTLFHGQAVRAGQLVGGAKVAPHLVEAARVEAGEAVARSHPPLVTVAPYLDIEVAAIAVESLTASALARFENAARTKVVSLGGRFAGVTQVADDDHSEAVGQLVLALNQLTGERNIRLILVGGVSAGDPLSPMYEALERVAGQVLRRGVPAHPGSMIWLGAVGEATLLGLPQCGMFSMATAADLVLPRLLTGERLSADTLADLGHGGLLGQEMRFRFPDYARDLESPA